MQYEQIARLDVGVDRNSDFKFSRKLNIKLCGCELIIILSQD